MIYYAWIDDKYGMHRCSTLTESGRLALGRLSAWTDSVVQSAIGRCIVRAYLRADRALETRIYELVTEKRRSGAQSLSAILVEAMFSRSQHHRDSD